MKKVTILALHLGYGGIEKCITSLANSLCSEYNVEIISTYKLDNSPAFPLNEKVEIKYLLPGNITKKVEKYKIDIRGLNFIKLIKDIFNDYIKKKKIGELFKDIKLSYKNVKDCKKEMIKAIQNCDSDIIISTRYKHNKLLGKYGKSKLKIGWEQNYHNNNKKYIKNVVSSIKNLDYFVLVTKEQQEFYQKLTNTKCIYIPNGIEIKDNRFAELDGNNLISVGRLSKEKGFLDLLDVVAYVKKIYPDVKLNLIGDGPEKEKIIKQIKQLNLEDNVVLHGYKNTEEINNILLGSSIYVMTSFTESFGLVLLEAAQFRIPLVSFKNSGSNDIISNNWDGYLIEDRNKEIMAKKIIELLKNKNRRIIMGNNAYKKCLKYDLSNIIKEWKKLIER